MRTRLLFEPVGICMLRPLRAVSRRVPLASDDRAKSRKPQAPSPKEFRRIAGLFVVLLGAWGLRLEAACQDLGAVAVADGNGRDRANRSNAGRQGLAVEVLQFGMVLAADDLDRTRLHDRAAVGDEDVEGGA